MLSHSDNVEASGFVQHLKLPHYVDFQSELVAGARAARRGRGAPRQAALTRQRNERCRTTPTTGYNFAYLDEQTKRMIRRAILKAVAIPGYQVPFGGREMPLPYGWGTGGIQVTAARHRPDDVLKVIDQGADDTTNAVIIRRFFARIDRRRDHRRAPTRRRIIQTRHRIPETPLREGQILVYQVPMPEPLRMARAARDRDAHACTRWPNTASCTCSLYEDIARHGRIATTYDYPVMVNGRYLMRPSPIPKFDNPKLRPQPGAAAVRRRREKRIYAVPPYTPVKSLDFDDHPFEVERWDAALRAVRRRATASSTR